MKTIQVLVLGDGYDRTLHNDNEEVLATPSAEALVPYLLANSNNGIFLLTNNLTRVHEYLVEPAFVADKRGNYKELYGSVFSSVTPEHKTAKHEHVLLARDLLANSVQHYHATTSTKLNAHLHHQWDFAHFTRRLCCGHKLSGGDELILVFVYR